MARSSRRQRPAASRFSVHVAIVALCLTAALPAAASATPSPGSVVGAEVPHGLSPALASAGVRIEAWTYPGGSGQATCRAPLELAGLPAGSPAVVKAGFLQVQSDGTVSEVTSHQAPCNGYSTRNAARLEAHGRRLMVSVTGQGRGVTSLVESAPLRQAAQRTIADFVSSAGLSGAELDFEPVVWSPTAWASYMTFVAGLEKALHGRTLEVDLTAWTSTPPDAERYLDPVLAGAKVVVMAFDHQYLAACSPIAPFRWLRQVVSYVQSQVPLSDVVVGLPSYGYRATSCSSPSAVHDNVPYVTMAGSPGFPGDAGASAHRDPASGEVRWTVGHTLYDYVDAPGLRAKLRLVEGLGVQAVSVWSLGGNPWLTGNPSP